MGTLTRTIKGTCTSNGYKYNGQYAYFNNSIDGGTAYSGVSADRVSITVKKFKSWDSRCYFNFYVNGNFIGDSEWLNANSSVHDSTTELYDTTIFMDSLIPDSINSLSIEVITESGNGSTYFYRYDETLSSAAGGSQIEITVYADYPACKAPTSVTLNGTTGNINVASGAAVTLAWSGASGTTINPITGYRIYKNGSSWKDVAANVTSLVVDTPSVGNSITYTVQTLGSRQSSGQSMGRSVYVYSSPTAPTTVTLNGTGGDIHVPAGSTITLAWSGGSAGTGNADTGYAIYRDGVLYASKPITTTSVSVTCPAAGGSHSYSVVRKGTYSNSGYSVARTGYAYANPTAPSVVTLNGTSGNIHVPAGTAVTLAWSGGSAGAGNADTGYQVYKGTSAYGNPTTNTSMTVDTPSAGSSFAYSVVRKGTYSNSSASVARTLYAYNNPTPPTSVKANNAASTIIDAGTNATLSWSGAGNGSGNVIKKYQIYRASSAGGTYSAYGSPVTSSPANVPAPTTMGASYFYKVVAVGEYSSSGQSESYAEVKAQTYSAVSQPTNPVVSPNMVSAGGAATFSWGAASNGTNVTVTGYEVVRSTSQSGEYTSLSKPTGTSMNVTAPSSKGSAYWYKVRALGSRSGFDGYYTAPVMLAVPADPNAPIIQGAVYGKSYNPRPRVLATIPSNAIEGVLQTIQASGWTASRTGVVAGEKVVLRRDTEYSSDGTFATTFSTVDSFGGSSGKNANVRYQAPAWTDDPIERGSTQIKAVHMNEMRDALDNIRLWYGMDAHSWSEPIVAGQTPSINWAQHAIEIKDVILEVIKFVNEWDSTNKALDIALPTISTAYAPSADVMNRLRTAITQL